MITVVFVLRKSCAAPTLLRTSPPVSWRSQREAKSASERQETDRLLSELAVWTHVQLLHGGLQARDDGADVFLKMISADGC